ncbi:MAG: amidohydrolase family protein, partial [Alphaproteobacteria bacterium]
MPDSLLRGRYVVSDPRRLPDEGLVEDGAVLVSGESVTAVGPFAALRRENREATVIGSGRHLVMPGLVNAHSHGRGLAALRLGVLDDYLERWLLDWLAMRPLDLYLDTLYAAMRMVRSGVTAVIHSGYARQAGRTEAETRDSLRAYRAAGVRVAYALGIEDRPSAVHGDQESFLAALPRALAERVAAAFAPTSEAAIEEYFDLMGRLQAEHERDPRVALLYGPSWPVWCSD